MTTSEFLASGGRFAAFGSEPGPRSDVLDTMPGADREKIAEPFAPTFRNVTDYLEDIINPGKFAAALDRAARALSAVEFDSIAATGLSGIVFAAALSVKIGKPAIYVRKLETPHTHSSRTVEGPDSIYSFVIVDDFVSTGATVRRIVGAVAGQYGESAKCVGVYAYTKDYPWEMPASIHGKAGRAIY